MDPKDLLVRLPSKSDQSCEYYGKITSDAEMVDWISDPTTADLLHVDRKYIRWYRNLQINDYDTMFQFKGIRGDEPSKFINVIRAADERGDKLVGVEAFIYPDDVLEQLPPADDYRIFRCTSEQLVLQLERRLRVIHRYLRRLFFGTGIVSIVNYDPITGKSQIWLQWEPTPVKSDTIRIWKSPIDVEQLQGDSILFRKKTFNLHEWGEVRDLFAWAKETARCVPLSTVQQYCPS
jgi:hypothetical protein